MLFLGENNKQFKNPLMIEVEKFIGPENMITLPEFDNMELENLLKFDDAGHESNNDDLNESTRKPMRFNFSSIADVSGIGKFDETPMKVISQPISLEAKKDTSQSSSKRKQNLNVTRDEMFEFIENVEDSTVRRHLHFDSSSLNSSIKQISIELDQVEIPISSHALNTSVDEKRMKSKKKLTRNKTEGYKLSITGGNLAENLKSAPNVNTNKTPEIQLSYSESKRGLKRITCDCKKTFRSEDSFFEHKKFCSILIVNTP
jgi:hypothetical protein